MKKVICFGTFDLLHLGHLYYFEQAKQHGDYLIVVIARDKTKQGQKKDILFDEQERLKIIQSLRIVDEAVLGYFGDHYRIIEEKKPDVLCLGYDQKINEKKLAVSLLKRGVHLPIFRLKSYKVRKQKSSKLKNKLFFMRNL